MQNSELDTYLIKCTKINSKWIKELNVRTKTIKLGKVDVNLCDLGLDNSVLDMTPEAEQPKRKQINWTLSKLKTFVHQRILSRGGKDSPQNERKYCKLYVIRT